MPHPSTNSFNDQPVVILGAARSGTKLLRALVAATGRYAEVPYDVNYIWRFGNESCPHDALPVECLADRTRAFVRDRLRRCAKLPTGGTALVEKTVSNVLRVPFVREVYPDAKYIAIVRDGRDVVESAERCWRDPPSVGDVLPKLRTFPWLQCAPYGWKYAASAARRCLHLDKHLRTWGPRYPGIDDDVRRLSLVEVCARQWLASIEHYEQSRQLFATDQLLELRYEDLVGDPPAQIRRICDFLDVADDAGVCRHARRVIRADRIGTHTQLTEESRKQVIAIIGAALGRWGYGEQGARSSEQGARSSEQGARSSEQGAGSGERGVVITGKAPAHATLSTIYRSTIPAPVSDVVRFAPPAIGEAEISQVVEALASEWITTGPKTALFEQRFGEYVGAPAALALNSCTAGLHLALVALDVGPGDEVITSTLTFAATVNVIEHVGARPVLVDVEPDTLNLDPRCVERAITPRTRAIVAVHYAGHPAEMHALTALAKRHGLAIVEDAAHALPAAYRGRRVGSSANLTSFSFYATKNLTTAEGGMLTGSPELIDRARMLSLHGLSRNAWNRYGAEGSWFYDVVRPGFKYNMTDIQAALGLAQLAQFQQRQQRRREIFARYDAALAAVSDVETPVCRPEVEHARHLYVLRLRDGALPDGRDELIRSLTEYGICTSVHFIPIHLHTFYREKYGYQPHDFPIALDNYRRMVSLPLSPALTDDEVTRVIDGVTSIVVGGAMKAAA